MVVEGAGPRQQAPARAGSGALGGIAATRAGALRCGRRRRQRRAAHATAPVSLQGGRGRRQEQQKQREQGCPHRGTGACRSACGGSASAGLPRGARRGGEAGRGQHLCGLQPLRRLKPGVLSLRAPWQLLEARRGAVRWARQPSPAGPLTRASRPASANPLSVRLPKHHRASRSLPRSLCALLEGRLVRELVLAGARLV